MQTSGSAFAARIEQAKNKKYELELGKIVDCFLDGYGGYNSNLVTSEINFYNLTIFFSPKQFKKIEVVV